jgi:hypothetical protein
MGLNESYRWCGRFGKDESILPLAGFEIRIIQPVSFTQYTDYAVQTPFVAKETWLKNKQAGMSCG